MDNVNNNNEITYNFPTPGSGQYFYGTDLEKLYSTLGDAGIFTINAAELSQEMSTISDGLKIFQSNIQEWLGQANDVEKESMEKIIGGLELSLSNVTNSIVPACDKIAIFKEKINEIKDGHDQLLKMEDDLRDVRDRISNIQIETAIQENPDSGLIFYRMGKEDNPYNSISDLDKLNGLASQKESEISTLLEKLDGLLVEVKDLYNEIKSFENDLKAFDFIIGPEYKGIINDKEALDLLPVFTQYMMYAGDYGSNQASPMMLFRYMPKLLGDDYEKLLDEDGHLSEEYGILAKKYNAVVDAMHKAGIYDTEEMIQCAINLNASGCGYAASTNIIFDMYKDDPVLFEASYGYPMYYLDDQNRKIYNYEPMLVDTFLNNLGKDTALEGDPNVCYVDPASLYDVVLNEMAIRDPIAADRIVSMYEAGEYDIEFCEPPVESRAEDVIDSWVGLSSEKNYIDCYDELLTKEGAVELYKEKIKNHNYAVIALYDYTLMPIGSNNLSDEPITGEGHYMQITGVSDNGNFIVTSWGREFELTDFSFVKPHTFDMDDEDDIDTSLVGKMIFM